MGRLYVMSNNGTNKEHEERIVKIVLKIKQYLSVFHACINALEGIGV